MKAPKAFAKPDEFIPERWTTQPDLIVDKAGFFPFLIGPFSCIGRQLALRELRVVTAKLVLGFDVSLAPGEDGYSLFNETCDNFTLTMGRLELCFKERREKD